MSEEKYKVVNPFDLHDLYCIFLGEHFEKLLKEMIEQEEWCVSVTFNIFSKATVPKTLWELRNVLEVHGLIEKRGTVLNPGMRITIRVGFHYKEDYIICQIDPDKMILISTKNWMVWSPKGFPAGTTLEELNLNYAYDNEYYTLTEE